MNSMVFSQHPQIFRRVKQVYSEMKGMFTLFISDPDEIISSTKKDGE